MSKNQQAENVLSAPFTVGQLGHVPWDIVSPMPDQPRLYFDSERLKQLQISIDDIGQQEPAQVVVWGEGELRIRDGERRWRCCRDLDISYFVIIKECLDEAQEFELAAIANLHREEHSPLERARVMRVLHEEVGYTYQQIADKLGCTSATVGNYLQLFKALDPRVLKLLDPSNIGDVEDGGRKRKALQHTIALELTPFSEHPEEQFTLALRIVKKGLSMSRARKIIRRRAEALGIKRGRGLQSRPSDSRKSLTRTLTHLGDRLDPFLMMNQGAIDRLFAAIGGEEAERFLEMINGCIGELQLLRSMVAKTSTIMEKPPNKEECRPRLVK